MCEYCEGAQKMKGSIHAKVHRSVRTFNYCPMCGHPLREPEALTLDEFESICESVHNSWWEEKIAQGVTDHPDMIPYADLAENVKDYDRVTVRRVLDALGTAYPCRVGEKRSDGSEH